MRFQVVSGPSLLSNIYFSLSSAIISLLSGVYGWLQALEIPPEVNHSCPFYPHGISYPLISHSVNSLAQVFQELLFYLIRGPKGKNTDSGNSDVLKGSRKGLPLSKKVKDLYRRKWEGYSEVSMNCGKNKSSICEIIGKEDIMLIRSWPSTCTATGHNRHIVLGSGSVCGFRHPLRVYFQMLGYGIEIYLFTYLCVYVCACLHAHMCTYTDPRMTHENWFSSSTVWVPGIKSRLSGLLTNPFTQWVISLALRGNYSSW